MSHIPVNTPQISECHISESVYIIYTRNLTRGEIYMLFGTPQHCMEIRFTERKIALVLRDQSKELSKVCDGTQLKILSGNQKPHRYHQSIRQHWVGVLRLKL
jgi:hypothetical protein